MTCFEKFALDIELLQLLRRQFTPVTFDEDALAFSAHAEIGPGGYFLGAEHTLERFRECFWRRGSWARPAAPARPPWAPPPPGGVLCSLKASTTSRRSPGDARRNVDFYARVLGLRMVKKTVNQDDPSVYHLFYADELGSAGADLTFFEYPGAVPGRARPGMVHRIVSRVASTDALDFWAARLDGEGVATERSGDSLLFADPEGMEHELVVVDRPDPPLVARHREIPAELALQGFEAVRASSMRPDSTRRVLEEGLNFVSEGDSLWEARGAARGGRYALDPLPEGRGVPGAGTVHHVAFASTMEDHEAWGERVRELGLNPTPVIDRFYFRSIYFREPGGVLFEIATIGPGFTSDEPLLSLGEHLSLPPDFEHLRERIEPVLTPLPDIRAWRPETT